MERNTEVSEATRKLIHLLEHRLDENLERMFKLLELKYPPEEIDTVFKYIKSEKSDIRLNAIEFLDNLLEASLKKVLIPIIETVTVETITRDTLMNLNVRIPDQYQCLDLLLQGKDRQLKMAVIDLIEVLKESQYTELLIPLSHHAEPSIRASTFRVLKKLSNLRGKSSG